MKKKPAPAKKSRRAAVRPRAKAVPAVEIWSLRLYVAGQTPRSLTAFANLKKLCDEHLAGRYELEVIDLMKTPALGQKDQIVALPTLIRKLPEPIKRVIGDLSNVDRVRLGIDLLTPALAP